MPLQHQQELIGKVLGGKYQVQRFLGAGSFAWVYLAVTSGNEPVAIKLLQNPSEDARKLFARECKILRALPLNPYCVGYRGDGETAEGMPYIVMEYIDGATLKDGLKFKPAWGVDEACAFMLQMCDALGGLHKLGLAHRDLKPENVMLTRAWQVKLMDFGLVKDAQGLLQLFEQEDILTGRDFAENIDKALLAGTPEYMAPEQFSDPMVDEDKAKTDTWSDVYSLGLIFYQLLTGRKLFPLKIPSGDQGAYAKALLDYLKVRTGFKDNDLRRPQEIPTELWPLLSRALRQNPKQRQRAAGELAEAIKRFLESGRTNDDFEQDEATSMGDMSAVLAVLRAQGNLPPQPAKSKPGDPKAPPASPGRTDPTTVRPPPKPGTQPKGPAVDVGAISEMRDHSLNRPDSKHLSIPPGVIHSADLARAQAGQTPATAGVLPPSIIPAPHSPSKPPGAVATTGGNNRMVLIIVAALVAIIASVVVVLVLKK